MFTAPFNISKLEVEEIDVIYILFYPNHEANVSNFKYQETRTSIVTITIFITLQLLGAVQFMTKILTNFRSLHSTYSYKHLKVNFN